MRQLREQRLRRRARERDAQAPVRGLDARLYAEPARILLASQDLVDGEAALVIVVGHQPVGGVDGDPDRRRAGDHHGGGPGHQDPGPGFAVPGSAHQLTSR